MPPSQQSHLPSESSLLGLPPELRNAIYRLSLVETQDIFISGSQPPPFEPSLLTTCRQIRNEAQEIYYEENKFRFIADNLDMGMFITFQERSPTHKGASVALRLDGTANWANLKVWLRAQYEGRCSGPGKSKSGRKRSQNFELARMCFQVQQKLKDQDLAWTEVEEVLEDLRGGMEAMRVFSMT